MNSRVLLLPSHRDHGVEIRSNRSRLPSEKASMRVAAEKEAEGFLLLLLGRSLLLMDPTEVLDGEIREGERNEKKGESRAPGSCFGSCFGHERSQIYEERARGRVMAIAVGLQRGHEVSKRDKKDRVSRRKGVRSNGGVRFAPDPSACCEGSRFFCFFCRCTCRRYLCRGGTSLDANVGLTRGVCFESNAKALGKRTKFVRELVREVTGLAPYEKRICELLKVGKDKRALKVAKKKVSLSMKRDEMDQPRT